MTPTPKCSSLCGKVLNTAICVIYASYTVSVLSLNFKTAQKVTKLCVLLTRGEGYVIGVLHFNTLGS